MGWMCAAVVLAPTFGCGPTIRVDDEGAATTASLDMGATGRDDDDPRSTTTTPSPPATTDTDHGSSGTTAPGDFTTAAATGTDDGDDQYGDEGSCDGCCGDGVVSQYEQCDCGGLPCAEVGFAPTCLGAINPSQPDIVYSGGILDCNPVSCQYSFGGCTYCGDGMLDRRTETCDPADPAVPTDTCASLGLGAGTDPLPCGSDCQIDTTCCRDPRLPRCRPR